jgi:hypothetical protein
MSLIKIAVFLTLAATAFAQERQSVEGFDKVEFHHDGNKTFVEWRAAT